MSTIRDAATLLTPAQHLADERDAMARRLGKLKAAAQLVLSAHALDGKFSDRAIACLRQTLEECER